MRSFYSRDNLELSSTETARNSGGCQKLETSGGIEQAEFLSGEIELLKLPCIRDTSKINYNGDRIADEITMITNNGLITLIILLYFSACCLSFLKGFIFREELMEFICREVNQNAIPSVLTVDQAVGSKGIIHPSEISFLKY